MSRTDRPATVPHTVTAPGTSGPGGRSSGLVPSRRATRRGASLAAAAVLAGGGVLGLGSGSASASAAVPTASAAGASDSGALQVRRSNATTAAGVELAVVPPAKRSAGTVRVVQGGRELKAQTEPLVSGRRPLAIVVQVQPDQLAQAQALVGDALAELPPDARVAVAPTDGSGAQAQPAAQDTSTALSELFRLRADPSASALALNSTDTTARSGAGALLVLTTCPGSERPDVGSAGTTAWVLGWGGGCRDAGPRTSSGVQVHRASNLPAALRALPGLLDQVAAARSVRVDPQGAQPLVVTAAGERATVSLGSSAGGSAAGAEALGAGRSAPAATGEQGSAWWTGLPARLALGVLAAAALLVAVERRRRRPTSARVPAPRRPLNQDDPWGRLVPEWTRTRPRTPETGHTGSSSPSTPATPPSSTPPRVIDLREPAQERPEVR